MSRLLWNFTLAATLPTDVILEALPIPFPVYASPKLDGVRCGVQAGVLVSRTGRPIPNKGTQEAFGGDQLEGVDGELTFRKPNAPDVFNKTTRIVMSAREEMRESGSYDIVFNVFDRCDLSSKETAGCVWQARMAELPELMGTTLPTVRIVEQVLIRNNAQLLKYEVKCLKRGYEGVMLRRADAGPYMQKRSTLKEFNLVKLKRFDHGTARIVGIEWLRHNKNEDRTDTGRRSSKKAGMVVDKTRVGRATLQDTVTKLSFGVAVQGDELQQWHGWAKGMWMGQKVRYKYQPVGVKDLPRFPTCEFKELLP